MRFIHNHARRTGAGIVTLARIVTLAVLELSVLGGLIAVPQTTSYAADAPAPPAPSGATPADASGAADINDNASDIADQEDAGDVPPSALVQGAPSFEDDPDEVLDLVNPQALEE